MVSRSMMLRLSANLAQYMGPRKVSKHMRRRHASPLRSCCRIGEARLQQRSVADAVRSLALCFAAATQEMTD